MTMVKVGIEFTRPIPEAWERAVWTVAPPSHFVSWLKLVWEPGDVWEPIERWMIYQMRSPRLMLTPNAAGQVSPHVLKLLQELRGPSPRRTGHYCAEGYCIYGTNCTNRVKTNRWHGGSAKMIDYAQWRLFQQTGHYGTRWWTIQGDQGGHRHRLDKTEERVVRIQTKGQITDTPSPGDLPYADFDSRVFYKIAALDRVRMWKGVTDYVHRNSATLDAAERDEGEMAQHALWSWLESQVKQTVDTIGRAGVTALRDAAPRLLDKPKPLDEEAIHQDFITADDS